MSEQWGDTIATTTPDRVDDLIRYARFQKAIRDTQERMAAQMLLPITPPRPSRWKCFRLRLGDAIARLAGIVADDAYDRQW